MSSRFLLCDKKIYRCLRENRSVYEYNISLDLQQLLVICNIINVIFTHRMVYTLARLRFMWVYAHTTQRFSDVITCHNFFHFRQHVSVTYFGDYTVVCNAVVCHAGRGGVKSTTQGLSIRVFTVWGNVGR